MFEWAADLMTRYAHVGDLVKDSGSIDSSDTLETMYLTRGLGSKYGPTPGCPGCATIGSHHQASHSDTCRDRMRAELEKSEEGREYLVRE